MQVLGAVGCNTLSGNELGQVERAFPRLEAALVEVGLDVALFQAGDELFVLVVGGVLGHELGADVEDFSPGEGERFFCSGWLDGELVVGNLGGKCWDLGRSVLIEYRFCIYFRL